MSFHIYRSTRKQIWPYYKNDQGQPRVIIWRTLALPSFKVFGLLVPKKIFLNFFLPYMGMVMWPRTFEQIFIPRIPWIWVNLSDLGQRPWHWVVTNCHVLICAHVFLSLPNGLGGKKQDARRCQASYRLLPNDFNKLSNTEHEGKILFDTIIVFYSRYMHFENVTFLWTLTFIYLFIHNFSQHIYNMRHGLGTGRA